MLIMVIPFQEEGWGLFPLDRRRRGAHFRIMQNPFDTGYYCSEELRSFGFARVGENVSIAKNCTIIGIGNIEIGNYVRIDEGCSIICTTGKLRMGNHIHIGGKSHFVVAADLTFEDLTGTSQGVYIYTSSDDYSGNAMAGPMVPAELRRATTRPIRIAKHALIGAQSVLLPGADLPEGCAVGTLSLVNKPLQPWSIYHGNPARRVGPRNTAIIDLAEMLETNNPASNLWAA